MYTARKVDMLDEVLYGIVASALCGAGVLFWRNRKHLAIGVLILRPQSPVRVSIAALLRVQFNDAYILFATPHRPGSYGPPGGVIKFHSGARAQLDEVDFREEVLTSRTVAMDRDLRGFIPTGKIPKFLRWIEKNVDRESSVECLRRELREELTEIGHPELSDLVEGLEFTPIRTLIEKPEWLRGASQWQLRRFEVYDLSSTTMPGRTLRDALLTLAQDPSESLVLKTTSREIMDGRQQNALIGPQSAFLFGKHRYRQDLPPAGD